MVKKEEYTGKSDSDHYLKYAMCYGDSMYWPDSSHLEKDRQSWIWEGLHRIE